MLHILSKIDDYRNFPHIGGSGEEKIRLVSDWVVMIERNGKTEKLKFEAGKHEYDGLTGWRIAAVILDPWRTIPAWVLHDDLYITQGANNGLTLEREEVDQLFYSCLIKLGIGKRRAWLAYKAVRMFGQKAWDDKG